MSSEFNRRRGCVGAVCLDGSCVCGVEDEGDTGAEESVGALSREGCDMGLGGGAGLVPLQASSR